MSFNSFEFVVFFPLVVLIYFCMPAKWRNLMLLAASYYFYMCWKAEYIFLIVISTIIDYAVGLRIGGEADAKTRKSLLLVSLVANLGLLFIFKYANFFSDSAREVLNSLNIFYGVPHFNLLLPVGISFYTFQTLSYTIDVYRGKKKPEKSLLIFALYVSFFPQLVAGPIERSTRLIPQFHRVNRFDMQRFIDGSQLMLWGFYKKIVISDRLAEFVDTVYGAPTEFSGIPLIMATVMFGFQIYCDFSGYSDIAIGAARILGYDLMNNFNHPYFSVTVPDYWRRWHISLSSWIKDYLYIPLGGNRVSRWRYYFNLFFIFLVCGLWHGASWMLVLWGGLHGLYMVGGAATRGVRSRLRQEFHAERFSGVLKFAGIACTFSLVTFSWVLFRGESIGDSYYIATHLFSGLPSISDLANLGSGGNVLGLAGIRCYSIRYLLVVVINVLFMEFVHILDRPKGTRRLLNGRPALLRWPAFIYMFWSIVFLGHYGYTEFIYFQF